MDGEVTAVDSRGLEVRDPPARWWSPAGGGQPAQVGDVTGARGL